MFLLALPLLLCVTPAWAAVRLRLVPLMADGSGLVIASAGGREGAVCPEKFGLREATVVCRQLGLGWGRFHSQEEFNSELIPSSRYTLKVSRCYGNETAVEQCGRFAADPAGLPCDSQKALSVRCTRDLPDLSPDIGVLEYTSYFMRAPLYTLQCAMEEHCLAESAEHISRSEGYMREHAERYLLRFSSIIRNRGTAAFIPLLEKKYWVFHRCHRHYHSMMDFARYTVLDKENRRVAVGHKASFCLEDSECNSGVEKHFVCSRVSDNFGDQGISPGCQDTYFHDYDCQWVDVTDLPHGIYTFQMVINPASLVAESDYFNNGVECKLYYYYHYSSLRSCRAKHPLDLDI